MRTSKSELKIQHSYAKPNYVKSHTKTNKAINKVFKKGNKTVPTALNSWQHEVTIGERGNQWSDYFKIPHTANRDVNIKMFQYKILHRILATNKKLKQYGIKDSDNCDFCGIETESILHIFCECDLTTHIWQSIADWLVKSGIRIGYLSDSQIIFGDKYWDAVVNRIIIIAKKVIFNDKVSKKNSLNQIIGILKKQLEVEKIIATNNNKLCYFRGFWAPICDQITK